MNIIKLMIGGVGWSLQELGKCRRHCQSISGTSSRQVLITFHVKTLKAAILRMAAVRDSLGQQLKLGQSLGSTLILLEQATFSCGAKQPEHRTKQSSILDKKELQVAHMHNQI